MDSPEQNSFPRSPIEKCLRCNEVMNSLSSYKYHLRSKHAAVYSEDCPEGRQDHDAWSEILKYAKKICCPNCEKPFKGLQYFKHHMQWCGKEDETVVCDICDHTIKAMWYVQHERDHRKKGRIQEKMKQQEEEVANRTETKDADESHKRKAATEALKIMKAINAEQNDDLDQKANKRKKKMEKNNDDWNTDGENEEDEEDKTDDDSDDETFSNEISQRKMRSGQIIDVKNSDFFSMQGKFLQKLPSHELFSTLLPSHCHWEPLTERDTSQYLSTSRESVRVSVEKLIDSGSTEYTTLHWGEVIADDSQATAFVGGPVRTMKWCPIIADGFTQEQVLALAAGQVLWERQEMFKRKEGLGLIQFWLTGPLDSTQSPCVPALRLAFSLAHNGGSVVSMSWCPRGAYSAQTPPDTGILQRLGLLAIAGSDSNVLIYSIPNPECILRDQNVKRARRIATTPPVFRPPPSLSLTCANPEACGPCLSVSWQKTGDCDFVAGGYAQGYVHLWHLSSSSPFLRLSPTSLAPVRSFLAHSTAVLSIDWSWSEESHFATVALDSLIKIWDAEDTAKPIFHMPEKRKDLKGPLRVVTLGPAALKAIIFADDQRDQYSGMVYAVDLSWGFPSSVAGHITVLTLNKHAAAVWDLSFSDWFNAVVSGDSTGLLSISSYWPLYKSHSHFTTTSAKGLPIFTTQLDTDSKDSKDKGGKDNEDSAKYFDPSSAEGLRVKFVDHNTKTQNLKALTAEEALTRQTFTGPHGADITATCFNPNKASSMWVACGTKAGFIRLLHLSGLAAWHRAARLFFKAQTHTENTTS